MMLRSDHFLNMRKHGTVKVLLYYNLEKYDEVIKSCEKTLEIDPDYFYAWYGKGLALHSLNNYQEL